MFTTGNKFLIGSTVVAIIAAIAYGTTQNWLTGTIGLVAAGIALGVLAGFDIYTRDANVAASPDLAVEHTAAAQLAPGYSLWPLLMAFGGVTVVVGLVTYQAIFIIGTILLLAAGGEWMAQAWAERASADSVHNANVRSRMANPFEFPIAGVVAIGIIVYSFSRIMLWLSKTNTVFAFAVLAGILLAFAFLFAYRPSIKARAMISIVAIGAVGLVAGGAAAGIDGERETAPARDHRGTGPRGRVRGPGRDRGRREGVAGRRRHREHRRPDHARRRGHAVVRRQRSDPGR